MAWSGESTGGTTAAIQAAVTAPVPEQTDAPAPAGTAEPVSQDSTVEEEAATTTASRPAPAKAAGRRRSAQAWSRRVLTDTLIGAPPGTTGTGTGLAHDPSRVSRPMSAAALLLGLLLLAVPVAVLAATQHRPAPANGPVGTFNRDQPDDFTGVVPSAKSPAPPIARPATGQSGRPASRKPTPRQTTPTRTR